MSNIHVVLQERCCARTKRSLGPNHFTIGYSQLDIGHSIHPATVETDLANSNNDLRDFIAWCLEDKDDYPRSAR